MVCRTELRHRMLLFLLLFIAILGQVKGASEQNTQICNQRFVSCTSTEDRRRPVCGSDNLTYQNRCQLLRAQCQGMDVTMQHRGRCKGKAKNGRTSPLRGRKQKKGCGREDRYTFNRNLIRIFKTEHDRMTSATTGEEQQKSPYQNTDRVVLDWKFSTMDRDGDDFLAKPEYRDLRRLVKKVVKPKRCAKTFTKLCDLNEDEKISREEWVSCLGLDFDYESHEEEGGEKMRDSVMKETATTLSEQLTHLVDEWSQETREEPEVNDCYGDRKAVLEEQLTTNSQLYVPECTSDGRYQKIQCYKSTGYCWCVNEESGKPIDGTSIKDETPKCTSLPPPSRTMNGCPEPYKQNFIRELMSIMMKTMASSINATDIASTSVPSKDQRQLSPEVQVATWNFLMLDKNKNLVLEKKEWKNFRSLVSSKPQLRRCGKRLPRYCDVNQDRKISITEWLNCLSTQQNNTLTVNPTPATGRRGQNPLQIYLKSED